MTVFIPFFTGLIAAILGVLPPGLINMTVAKVRLTDGIKRALIFVSGALLVIAVQTYVSVVFARYISQHDEVVATLRTIGLVVFGVLTLYFFFWAKKPTLAGSDRIQLKSKRSRFFMGMLISALNLLPIPYYVVISVTLASYGYFDFSLAQELSLVAGVTSGSFLVFYLYIVFISHLKSKTDWVLRYMNRIMGTITGLVALLTLWNLLR